ncbi:MAG: ABC transporter substrate-binding protein [Candidatus Binatia bacterium]
MKKTWISLLAMLICWAWVPGRSYAQARNKITVGYASMSTVVTTLWVARDQGFFAKDNIDAELVFVPGSPVLLGALNSGDIQLGYGGGPANLGAAARGMDVKSWRLFLIEAGMILWCVRKLKTPRIYAASALALRRLEVRDGWARCWF